MSEKWTVKASEIPGLYDVYDQDGNRVKKHTTIERAKLIAAAPELPEALKNARIALTFYQQWMTRKEPGTTYPFGIDAENAARAALAKAKGEA